MNNYLYLIFTLLIISCSEKKESSEQQIIGIDNIIPLKEAFFNSRNVKLSEIADSISFIPLETSPDCFLRSTTWIVHAPPYLWFTGKLFDYNGRFFKQIVSVGPGPCQDIYPTATVCYNQQEELFISECSKLITYDKEGNCLGKEVQLFKANDEGRILSGKEINDITVAENHFLLNSSYDTLIWVNTDLEYVKSTPLPIPGTIRDICNDNVTNYSFCTSHKDSSLLYNYWNDTIYRVKSLDIEPRWVVDLGDKKIVEEVRSRYHKLLEEKTLFFYSFRYDGVKKTNECELVRLTKDNLGVYSVYETDSYLFFFLSEIVINAKTLDSYNISHNYQLQIAYYDKETGETVVASGDGFEDDLLGTGAFFPKSRAFNNRLVKMVWPHELTELLDKKRSENSKIHPKLLELEKQLDVEDNPVLFVVHLKK